MNFALALKMMNVVLNSYDEPSHTCEVCYDDKIGSEFLRIHCGHSFCLEVKLMNSALPLTNFYH